MSLKDESYLVEAPTPLLPFLLDRVRGKSRNAVKALLARGQVSVNGRAATRFDLPLSPGMTVTVAAPSAARATLPFPILYEDGDLIVVDKPAGLLSIATDTEKETTAYHMLTDCLRAAGKGERIFVVHRLDKDTSGVLLFTKNEAAKRAYQDDWSALVAKRAYVAVTEGVPDPPQGTVRSFLQETKTHLVFSGRGKDGKEAITNYAVRTVGGRYALVDVTIDTGRKNQIRVHLHDLGCPVVGDKKYGARTNPLGRLGLHASELCLRHPETGAEQRFAAPIPPSFSRLTRLAGR